MSSQRPQFSPLGFLRSIARAKLRPTTKLVAYTLLGFADKETGEVRARQAKLAEHSGLRPRAIRNALREIEAAGMLSTTYTKGAGLRTRLARYVLAAPARTCRSLTDEAQAPTCRTQRKAAARSDQRHRHARAEHSDSGDSGSSSKAPDGADATRTRAPSANIWTLGVTILTDAGKSNSGARELLGKWVRDHGEEEVAGALGRASRKANPVAYVEAILRNRRIQANGAELLLTPEEELAARGRPQ